MARLNSYMASSLCLGASTRLWSSFSSGTSWLCSLIMNQKRKWRRNLTNPTMAKAECHAWQFGGLREAQRDPGRGTILGITIRKWLQHSPALIGPLPGENKSRPFPSASVILHLHLAWERYFIHKSMKNRRTTRFAHLASLLTFHYVNFFICTTRYTMSKFVCSWKCKIEN